MYYIMYDILFTCLVICVFCICLLLVLFVFTCISNVFVRFDDDSGAMLGHVSISMLSFFTMGLISQ